MNAVELQVLLHTFVLTPSKGFPELGSNFDAQSNNCIMRSFLAADGCISFFLFSHIDSLLDSLSSDACNIHPQSMYNAQGNIPIIVFLPSENNYTFKLVLFKRLEIYTNHHTVHYHQVFTYFFLKALN